MPTQRAELKRDADKIAGEVIGYEHVKLPDGNPFRVFMHGAVTIPLHWHPEMEIVTVLAGKACFVVAGQQCVLEAGDVMIINANVVHNSSAWSEDAIVCGLHIDTEHYERLGLPEFSTREYLCRSFLHGKHFRTISDPLRSIIARLAIQQGHAAGENYLHSWLMTGLCYFIYNKVPWDKRKAELDARSNSGRERILHIMRRVRNEYQHDLSLQVMADEAGVSLSHLSRNFRAYVGLGFQEYVINLRLDRALAKIRETTDPVTEIAGQSGFSNSTLFFARFRERFGCTPAEFRNGHRPGIGPHQAAPLDNSATMSLLLAAAGKMETFGGFGAIEAPFAQLRLYAPHNIMPG